MLGGGGGSCIAALSGGKESLMLAWRISSSSDTTATGEVCGETSIEFIGCGMQIIFVFSE